MSEAAEKLKAAVLELPLNEQLELVDFIYANLPKPPGVMSVDDPGFDARPSSRRPDQWKVEGYSCGGVLSISAGG